MTRAIALAVLLIGPSTACVNDLSVAQSKAASCMACHGQAGTSNNDQWPNLAGQKKGYLVAQLQAYRSGKRKDVMMSPMAKKLTDKDIEILARYFSEQ